MSFLLLLPATSRLAAVTSRIIVSWTCLQLTCFGDYIIFITTLPTSFLTLSLFLSI